MTTEAWPPSIYCASAGTRLARATRARTFELLPSLPPMRSLRRINLCAREQANSARAAAALHEGAGLSDLRTDRIRVLGERDGGGVMRARFVGVARFLRGRAGA